MNTRLSGRARNIIFLVFLIITIFSVIFAITAAAEHDRVLLSDYNQYLKASQLINLDRYTEAKSIMDNLVTKYGDSYQILWMYGLCLSAEGKLAEAAEFMSRAREIRPALLTNQSYLVQYGEILYRLGDYSRAERYLITSRKYNKDPDLNKKSQMILEQIRSERH